MTKIVSRFKKKTDKPRVGRPKKREDHHRTIKLMLYFTKYEYQIIKQEFGNCISKNIRQLVLLNLVGCKELPESPGYCVIEDVSSCEGEEDLPKSVTSFDEEYMKDKIILTKDELEAIKDQEYDRAERAAFREYVMELTSKSKYGRRRRRR